jgi:outer membrane lipoprotein-sorting protein
MRSRKPLYIMGTGSVPICCSHGVTSARDMVRSLCAVFICCLFISMPAARAADPLDPVFARIDQAAKAFKGMSADIANTEYTSITDSKDVHPGTIKLLPAKDGTHVLLSRQDGLMLSFDGHKGRSYNLKTNIVDEKNISPNMVDQYLMLGFGASSAQLKASYEVAYSGAEQIGNQQTSHITLVPKSPDMRRDMKQAELWIGDNGLVVQQKIVRPDGDYQLFTYSHMTLGAMPEKDTEIKLRPGYVIQKH